MMIYLCILYTCVAMVMGQNYNRPAWDRESEAQGSCTLKLALTPDQIQTICQGQGNQRLLENIERSLNELQDKVQRIDKETESWREVVSFSESNPSRNSPSSTLRNKLSQGAADILALEPEPGIDLETYERRSMSAVKNKNGPAYKDCWDAYEKGQRQQGIYKLQPETSMTSFNAYCDEEGWTVIDKRFDGSVDFYRDWLGYSRGFGEVFGEYYLGHENVHLITSESVYQLVFEGEDWYGKILLAKYEDFKLKSDADNFALQVGKKIGGNAEDALSDLDGVPFTSKDRDNDEWDGGNCASYYEGGWWNRVCGFDLHRQLCDGMGCMRWGNVPMKKYILKIRPSQAVPRSSSDQRRKPKRGKTRRNGATSGSWAYAEK